MNDDLLNYYERELTFIREMGAEFAQKYPKIAGRLLLEPDKCDDPHTERLIEAFAFLCGRVHKKIDDDFPEITESLLQILYPHYISPIPSMSVVTFAPVSQTIGPGGYRIDRDTRLYSKPVHGVPCQFVTKYPVRLWPVEVVSARLADPRKPVGGAQQAIVIQLKSCNGLAFPQTGLDRLRFFLNGSGQHVYHLYELLFNNVRHVECVSAGRDGKTEEFPLRPEDILPVGFGRDESLIPYHRQSSPGYLLLFEYFCFPEKFLFFDVSGLERVRRTGFGDSMELWFYLDRSAKPNLVMDKDTFRLNAAPIINLYSRVAEPVRVSREKTEYLVVPDIRRSDATEVFSIDRVIATSMAAGQEKEYHPFYSVRHHLDDGAVAGGEAFWHGKRSQSGRKGDNGTDVYLAFTDLDYRSTDPETEVVTVHVTCTNRDLPGRMNFNDPEGDFEMETAAPVSAINCLVKPTQTRRPSLKGALQWRLISHLSLNHFSLTDGGETALREILMLYDFDNSPATRQQINGIAQLQPELVTKRIGHSFCRGVKITITFDEDKYVGTGLFLFATVLEHFLGQYVSINSFSQLVARTIQRKERLRQWPPRNGNRILL